MCLSAKRQIDQRYRIGPEIELYMKELIFFFYPGAKTNNAETSGSPFAQN